MNLRIMVCTWISQETICDGHLGNDRQRKYSCKNISSTKRIAKIGTNTNWKELL